MLQVRIAQVTFSDNTQLSLPESGITIFVGPNNAGKSQALKDLIGFANTSSYQGKTITDAEYVKSTDGDVEKWFSENLPPLKNSGQIQYQVEGWGRVPIGHVVTQWTQPDLNVLTPIFVMHADGTSRLTAGSAQPNINFAVEAAVHPIQATYQNPDLEHELNNEGLSAFGLGVTVDRYGGSIISLRLGSRPTFEHDDGVPKQSYLEALRSMPTLEEQGDGIRSYLGLVLHLVAGFQQVTLIDEPEAFLHPPQARRLGGVLARKAAGQQVAIATHSTNIVQGALDQGVPTTIIRIARDGNVNHASVLNDEAVKGLWANPLLRYSNILDGLFHDAVVLCESDADCRYYSAVLDQIPMSPPMGPGGRGPQLLFTHCGGKARMSSVIDALTAVNVPVVVVADFDVLRNPTDVEKVVASLGADFEPFKSDLQLLARQLQSDSKPLRKVTLKDEFNERIDALKNDIVDQREVEHLRAIMRVENGWDKAKRAGIGAVSQGDAYLACQRLLEALQSLGFLVVPVGELERFAPEVSGHGPGWVSNVLDKGLHLTPSHQAFKFARSIRDAAMRNLGGM